LPVAVTAPSGGKIVFSKIDSPQKTGTPFSVTLTVKDFADNIIADTGSPIVLTDTTGSVSPRVIKTLSAGTWTGEVKIDEGAEDVVITATSGGFSGASNSFKVEGQGGLFRKGSGGGAAKALGLTDSNKVAFAIVSGLGLLGSLLALGLMASKGMQAIGRNPMAKKQILLNLYLNAGIAILGAFISVALAILLQKL
jgi:F0F1-type ATP synthase membrane subunit c/vacuolar-type H+-ATPase subunit K